MLATAHKWVQRLTKVLTIAAVTGLTVGGGIIPALIVALGECPGAGSGSCG